MVRIGIGKSSIVLLAALFVGNSVCGLKADDKPKAKADDKVDFKQKVLALNDVTGDDSIKGEIKALMDDPNAKKLLAVASTMAKEKDQPFQYPAAFILANAAYGLKDLEASQTFFWICAEQANMLQSSQKLTEAYTGLLAVIEGLYNDKKYDASGKLSQQFLEMLEKKGVAQEAKNEVILKMLRAWVKQGKTTDANNMVAGLLKGHENEALRLYLKARYLSEELQDSEGAAKAYEQVLSNIDKDKTLRRDRKAELRNKARYNLAGIYLDQKKADKAVELLKALRQDSPLQSEYLRRLLRGLVMQNKNDEATKLLDEFVKGSKNEFAALELKASLLQELSRYADAVKVYEEMLQKVDKNKEVGEEDRESLKESLQYIMSGLFIEMDQVDKAIEILRALQAKHKDATSEEERKTIATYNNDLGYVLADHDRDLDQAEKMIRKAVEYDPKAAYLDSLGWVLFKKKQYAEAKKYLLEATQDKKEGQHVEILDHLVDVYLAMGDKPEAIKVLKKALTQETTSKREKERQAKMRKKLEDLEKVK